VQVYLEDSRLGVLVRDAEHDDCSAVVTIAKGIAKGYRHRSDQLTTSSEVSKEERRKETTDWSKSIPSETFPRATERRTAPRPLLQA
jgi:hypothetical protein